MTEGNVENLLPRILDSLLEGFQVIGFDWRYLYVNETVATQGRKTKAELLGRTMMEAYPGIETTAMFALLGRCMSERTAQRMENEFTFADGTSGWFELVIEPVPEGVSVLSLDITERKRAQAAAAAMEQQLRHAQKMEAIGHFASGIAHDINNILSVIQLYGGLVAGALDQTLDPTSEIFSDVAEIRRAGDRATALMRQLLAFSRRQVLELTVVDLNQVVIEMEHMLGRLLGSPIDLEFKPASDLHAVLADASQLEQVVMNLALNARDAMLEGGKLTIETANVHLNGSYTSTHLGVAEGDYVMLAVSDTGIGMNRATQERIFDPFFTTKPKSKGTGIGLSTVYGIVKQCGGHVWVYSEPGHGTTIKVYLPRRASGAALAAPPAVVVERLTGNETVLVVEDDEQVRAAAKETLTKAGYQVIETLSAEEALKISDAYAGKIELLLTDVVMPHINGIEVARLLSARRPEMRVLCMSGYPDAAVVRSGDIAADVAFLQKPLTPEGLLKKVRQVLER